MDAHRVRRLATTLVASQLRSGRSTSDPNSLLSQPGIIATVDIALFFAMAAIVWGTLGASGVSRSVATALADSLLPFLPLVAVGVVLVAGVMFELTTTAKFAQSDTANWLPITPGEYVAASATAIGYTYSPAVALVLGSLLPLTIYGGTFGPYLLALVLSILALFEGAVLVEMVRSATQRVSTVGAGRRGQVSLLLRAVVLVLVILALQLAFNPVFLLGVAQRLSAVGAVVSVVPFFWSTEALVQWIAGNPGIGLAFALGQLAFLGLLVYLAGELRVRYWAPSAPEVRLEEHQYAARNPFLALLGLTSTESALVVKDLKGLVRRREMLPTLVVPVVLMVLVVAEGSEFGEYGSLLWVGWVAGFFSLLIASTSLGQERRAVQSLFAFPLSVENLVRAKAAYVLLPSLVVAVALGGVVGVFFRLPLGLFALVVLLVLSGSVILTFWGLAFATRFSDFQDRPRPQFLGTGAMLAATGSGMVLLFAILLLGASALLSGSSSAGWAGLACGILVVMFGALAVVLTLTGFRQLLRELPF